MNALAEKLAVDFEDKEYADAYLEENSNLRIAAQVRALRLRMGWSQEQLAEQTGMRQERISKIEMADFESLTLKTLRRLASAFDVHLAVQFSAISDAVSDFVTLSNERLCVEDRSASLAKMRLSNSRANVVVTGGASPTTPISRVVTQGRSVCFPLSA